METLDKGCGRFSARFSAASRVVLGVLIFAVVYVKLGFRLAVPRDPNLLALVLLGVGYLAYSVKACALTSALFGVLSLVSSAFLIEGGHAFFGVVSMVLGLFMLYTNVWVVVGRRQQ